MVPGLVTIDKSDLLSVSIFRFQFSAHRVHVCEGSYRKRFWAWFYYDGFFRAMEASFGNKSLFSCLSRTSERVWSEDLKVAA